VEAERPGSRRAGQGSRPGSRPPGAHAEQVELTVAFDAPPGDGPPAAAGQDPPPRRAEVDLEHLFRHLPALQEAARAAGLEAGREEARAFLQRMEKDNRAARIQDRADALETLQSAAEEVASASQGVDMLLNEIGTRADEILAKLEESRAADERREEQAKARAEEQMKRLRAATDRAVEEARDAARAASWRPWVMATACALVLTLGVSLLRPGWTMSPSQRRAERVGDTVIRAYEAASPAERVEVRRVMGWRDPPPADTSSARR
jgi:ElaB/YqjD/DUF883 family membrane-anchored ribosome-binding protein